MKTFFPDIPEKIPYEGPDSKNPLAFRYYNPQQVVGQKSMEEHLRFSVAYWHTFKASGMDTFARGLIAAHQIMKDGVLDSFLKERYASYTDGIGKQIMNGRETFETLEEYVIQKGEPILKSGRQEMLESILHSYV